MDPQKTPTTPPEDKDAPSVPDLGAPAVTPEASGDPAPAAGPNVFTGSTPETTPEASTPEPSAFAQPAAPAPEAPAEPLPELSNEASAPEAMAGQTFSPSGSAPENSTPTAPAETPFTMGGAPADNPEPSNTPVLPGPIPEASDMQPNPLPVTDKKRGKKGLIFGLIVAAVVLLLSGGAAASYYYFVNNKPENILKQALANSVDPEKTKTVHYTATMAFGDDDMTVNTNFNIAADNNSGAFDVSGSADALITNIKFDARSTDGKTYYVRLGGLNGLDDLLASTGMTEAAAPIITLLNDQWIEINQSLIEQMGQEMDISTVLNESDKRKIAEAYMKYPFVVIKEVLPTETIKGKSSYHYKVAIDPAALKTFIVALKEANLDVYKPDQEVIDEVNKAIDQAKFDKYPFEVWIAKDTKMFSQLRLAFTDEDGVKTDAKLTVESYNQPVKVEKPENTKSILEIVGEFSKLLNEEYGDLLGGATLPDGISL